MKDIKDLGRPDMVMGDNADKVPNPPWFTKPTFPTIPVISAVNEYSQTVELPYIRYTIIDNEPMLLGTQKKNGEVYRDYLKAFPMPTLSFESHVNDSALEGLYIDYPFNWTLNLALYHMGDAGVLTDVH